MASDDHYLLTELVSLLRSDDRIRESLPATLTDGIWYRDLEQPDHEWMNERFWEVLGHDPADRQHRSSEWRELMHPDDLTLAEDNLARHIADPSLPYDQVVRFRTASGTTVWVRRRGVAIRDETGRATRMLGCHTNVTELMKLEARFGGVLESLPDAIVLGTITGEIALVNSEAERMFGYSRAEMIGSPVEMLLPERYRDAHVGHRQRFANAPTVRPMGKGLELFGRRKDGSEFPVEISLSPVDTGDAVYVSSAIRDASERRLVEAGLQEASRLKSEFLANMSHELRTPLNGIIGFSEFLVDEKPGPLNDRQKEYLQDVLSSASHLLRLINDVLDLSKIEAGRMDLHAEPFALTTAVDEVCTTVSPVAGRRGIRIRREISPPDATVNLDQHRFKQILFNLLSNAVKFSDENAEVWVVAASTRPGLELRVIDTGIGIKPADQERLFDQFQQLDSGAARRYSGTGLGLALTHRLVELHRGRITVDSQPGEGSTFTVFLPVSGV